jgi:hypothetical protein
VCAAQIVGLDGSRGRVDIAAAGVRWGPAEIGIVGARSRRLRTHNCNTLQKIHACGIDFQPAPIGAFNISTHHGECLFKAGEDVC